MSTASSASCSALTTRFFSGKLFTAELLPKQLISHTVVVSCKHTTKHSQYLLKPLLQVSYHKHDDRTT